MSIALLNQYMEDAELSQNQVAIQLGVSSSKVSQYRNAIYKGDVKAMDKSVEQLVARYQAKKADVSGAFVQTDTAKKIVQTCAMAHAMVDMCLVIGEAGMGKTRALKQYADTNDSVILIEVDGTYSPKVVLVELCRHLGLDNLSHRANYLMMSAIVEKLKGSDVLIVVDEAELLSYKALELIRRIHDKADVGVVLAGLPRLRANLQGARGEFAQLYSRIGMQFDMPSTLPDKDVALLAQSSIGSADFNGKLTDACRGNARRLNKLCRAVVRVAQRNNVDVNENLIDECAKLLVG